jgi:hypothetical protein
MDSKPSVVKGFAFMLETACEDFEIMQRPISNDLVVIAQGGQRASQEPSR